MAQGEHRHARLQGDQLRADRTDTAHGDRHDAKRPESYASGRRHFRDEPLQLSGGRAPAWLLHRQLHGRRHHPAHYRAGRHDLDLLDRNVWRRQRWTHLGAHHVWRQLQQGAAGHSLPAAAVEGRSGPQHQLNHGHPADVAELEDQAALHRRPELVLSAFSRQDCPNNRLRRQRRQREHCERGLCPFRRLQGRRRTIRRAGVRLQVHRARRLR